ncbi:hypothetical protein N9L68_02245 [bacterium]|nr:hypothetical protein [bacterium]
MELLRSALDDYVPPQSFCAERLAARPSTKEPLVSNHLHRRGDTWQPSVGGEQTQVRSICWTSK